MLHPRPYGCGFRYLVIKEKSKKFRLRLIAYIIANNHLHLMLEVPDGKILAKFISELNGASSRTINIADNTINRKIWWNYFDHIIRDQSDFFKHLNYIHQNPIKHKLAKELSYQFSSYNLWLKRKGKEYLDQAFEKYPIVDFLACEDEY